MTTYKILRFFQRPDEPTRCILRGLTLQEAQAHCSDPQTSSQTCKGSYRNGITRSRGPWFDGYTEE